jgi:hypothetical protein
VKRKLSLFNICMVIVALGAISYAPAQNAAALLTVMNPAVANKVAQRIPLAPRLDTLEGKTLYMADIGWGGPEAGYSVFEEMQAWLAKNMPSVKTVIRRFKGSYENDQPELWKEIAANGNAAIIGISG